MGLYKPWPAEDETKLFRLVQAEKSATVIALEFGGRYSRNAVIGKCNRLGLALSGRRGPPGAYAQLAKIMEARACSAE